MFPLELVNLDTITSFYTSDMQALVWGEPDLAHEYDFDVENIIAENRGLKCVSWRNTTSEYSVRSLCR